MLAQTVASIPMVVAFRAAVPSKCSAFPVTLPQFVLAVPAEIDVHMSGFEVGLKLSTIEPE